MKNNISSLSEFKGIKNFNNLDGLRGLAIFAVIFHHVPESDYAFLDILQANGRYGVSLFFVISGFLISSLLLREKEKKRHDPTQKVLYTPRAAPLSTLLCGVNSLLRSYFRAKPIFTGKPAAIPREITQLCILLQ
jgi:peptidoglycan/LPS O-acetylase OafA/YrhL